MPFDQIDEECCSDDYKKMLAVHLKRRAADEHNLHAPGASPLPEDSAPSVKRVRTATDSPSTPKGKGTCRATSLLQDPIVVPGNEAEHVGGGDEDDRSDFFKDDVRTTCADSFKLPSLSNRVPVAQPQQALPPAPKTFIGAAPKSWDTPAAGSDPSALSMEKGRGKGKRSKIQNKKEMTT